MWVFEAATAEVLMDAVVWIWDIYLVALAMIAATAVIDRIANGPKEPAKPEQPAEDVPATAGRIGPRTRTSDRNRRRAA